MNKKLLMKIRGKNVEKQRRRRVREKKWLHEHGYESWEALHTRLMNNSITVIECVDLEKKETSLE